MKRLIRPVAWTAATAVALFLVGAAAARRLAPVASAAPPAPEVTVLTVVPETVTARFEYVAQAAASRSVEVRSQVTGVIAARPYAEGTAVAKGTLLSRIDATTYDAAYRSAQAPLPNADRTLADGSLFPVTGELNFADLALQPATGTQQMRAQLRNPQHVLLPGQFVRVRLLGLKRPSAILVPQRAVQQGLNGAYVYVVDDSGKVAARNVVATSWDGGSWRIEQGLEAGDRLIVDGVQKVAPGQPARPVAYRPAADSAASAARSEERRV